MSRFLSIVKTLGRLLGSYLLILLIAGLVAVPVYWVLEPIIGRDIDRYVDRMRYVGLLFLLPLWWRWADLSWKKIGWKRWRVGAIFTLFGLASVLCVGLVAAIYNQVAPVADPSIYRAPTYLVFTFLPLLLKGLLAGFVVALIEELVFRGVMVNLCVKGCGMRWGIWIAAIIFAWMHGRPHMDWVSAQVGWSDGLRLAWDYVATMPKNLTFVELVNLIMLGGVLGMLYYKSKSLWVPIGMHLGIVAAVVIVGDVVRMFGLTPISEALTEIPVTTVMLSVWVVGVAAWPDPLKAASDDSAEEKSA